MRKIKKLFTFMTALLMTAGLAQPLNVKAASTLVMEAPYGTVDDPTRKWSIGLTEPNGAGWYSDSYARFYIDDQKVYCVQPLVVAVPGTSDYEVDDLDNYSGSAETTRTIKRISSLGYGYGGDYSDEMDFATQIRIWQEISPGLITNIDPEIQEKIDEINGRLAVLETTVSFSGETVKLSNYGKENGVTLTDSTGKFDYYDQISVQGAHFEKSGNSLTVWAEKSDSLENAKARYAAFGWTSEGTAIAYYSDYSQAVAYITGGDPKFATVDVDFTVEITVDKEDADTEGRPQGDASFEGTTFEVTDTTTGEVVGTLEVAADGTANTISGLLPIHGYSLHETKAGEGYNVNETDTAYTGDEVADLVEDGKVALKVPNEVYTGKFSIKKIITDSHASGFVKPEEGAEFTAILKSYVDEVGDFDAAAENVKAGASGLTEKEYAIITTDANGEATSGDMAYGTYVIKQTDGDKELAKMHPTFEFTVSEDKQPTVNFTISNISKEYYVRVVKKDAETGKQIIMTPAKFKIKDSEGKYVTQKVGSVTYDTFVTTAKEVGDLPAGAFYVDTEEEGTTVTPLTLMPGEYTLEEVDVPDGYVFPEEDLEFTLAEEEVVEGENPEEDFQTIELTANNEQAKGKLELTKTVIQYNADKTLVDKKDLSGIGFTLYAKEDIIDPADGEVLYAAGSVYGEYNVDKDGNLTVEDIPMGKYYLLETTVPAGYIKDETEYPVEFVQTDKTTKIYPVALKLENYTTRYEFTKKDIGGEEVEGAKITIIDKDGNVVDSWTSTKEAHKIEGLEVGKTYKFKEEQAPDGYYYVVETEFTVISEKEIQHVDIVDKEIRYQILKVDDVTGEPVTGVTLELYDTTDATEEEPDGTKVGKWVTDGNPIVLSISENKDTVLIAGHTYKLVESEIVAGVYKATDISFTVDKENPESDEMITITMVDVSTGVHALKVSPEGKPLPGAKMSLFEATEKKTVDEETGEETIEYVIAEDAKPVYEWTSSTKPEDISDYVKGDYTYIIREDEAPFGFEETHDITFKVTGKNDVAQVVLITDMRKTFFVAVTKVDAKDESKKLSGAEFAVYNAKTDEPVKTAAGAEVMAVTGADGVATFHLTYSEDGYYIKETVAPAGYKLNSDKFAVTLSGSYDFAKENPIKITVKDDSVPNTGIGVPISVGGMGVLALTLAFLLNKNQLFSK